MTVDAARAKARATIIDRPSFKEAALGALLQARRAMTVGELANELDRRFTSVEVSRDSRNYVRWVVRDFAEQGLVTDGPPLLEPRLRGKKKKETLTYVVVTEAAAAYIRRWICEPIVTAEPAIELLVRFEFCPEELIGELAQHVEALQREACGRLYRLKGDPLTLAATAGTGLMEWSSQRKEIRSGLERRYWEFQVSTLEQVLQEMEAAGKFTRIPVRGQQTDTNL